MDRNLKAKHQEYIGRIKVCAFGRVKIIIAGWTYTVGTQSGNDATTGSLIDELGHL